MRNQIIPLHRGVAPIRPDHISRIVGDPDAVFARRDWGQEFREAVRVREDGLRAVRGLTYAIGFSTLIWGVIFWMGGVF